MVCRWHKTQSTQARTDCRSTAQTGFGIRTVARHEKRKTGVAIAEGLRRALPSPRFEKLGLHRIVVNGNEEISTDRLLRPFLQTRDTPVKIHRADSHLPLQERLGQTTRQGTVEMVFAHAAGAGRSLRFKRMPDIHRDFHRACRARHQAKQSSQKSCAASQRMNPFSFNVHSIKWMNGAARCPR